MLGFLWELNCSWSLAVLVIWVYIIDLEVKVKCSNNSDDFENIFISFLGSIGS